MTFLPAGAYDSMQTANREPSSRRKATYVVTPCKLRAASKRCGHVYPARVYVSLAGVALAHRRMEASPCARCKAKLLSSEGGNEEVVGDFTTQTGTFRRLIVRLDVEFYVMVEFSANRVTHESPTYA